MEKLSQVPIDVKYSRAMMFEPGDKMSEDRIKRCQHNLAVLSINPFLELLESREDLAAVMPALQEAVAQYRDRLLEYYRIDTSLAPHTFDELFPPNQYELLSLNADGSQHAVIKEYSMTEARYAYEGYRHVWLREEQAGRRAILRLNEEGRKNKPSLDPSMRPTLEGLCNCAKGKQRRLIAAQALKPGVPFFGIFSDFGEPGGKHLLFASEWVSETERQFSQYFKRHSIGSERDVWIATIPPKE